MKKCATLITNKTQHNSNVQGNTSKMHKNFTRFVQETLIASTKQSRRQWFMLRPRQRRDIKQWWWRPFARL